MLDIDIGRLLNIAQRSRSERRLCSPISHRWSFIFQYMTAYETLKINGQLPLLGMLKLSHMPWWWFYIAAQGTLPWFWKQPPPLSAGSIALMWCRVMCVSPNFAWAKYKVMVFGRWRFIWVKATSFQMKLSLRPHHPCSTAPDTKKPRMSCTCIVDTAQSASDIIAHRRAENRDTPLSRDEDRRMLM